MVAILAAFCRANAHEIGSINICIGWQPYLDANSSTMLTTPSTGGILLSRANPPH